MYNMSEVVDFAKRFDVILMCIVRDDVVLVTIYLHSWAETQIKMLMMYMNNVYLLNIIRMMKVGPNSAFMHTKYTFDIASIS